MFRLLMFVAGLLANQLTFADRYTGPIIDAMAQYSKGIPVDSVIKNYQLAGVTAALMYPGPGIKDFISIVTKSDGLIVPLDTSKAYSKPENQFLEISSIQNAVGLGEVIVQHYPMKGDFGFGPYEFKGFTTRLKDHPAVVKGVERKYPIFLHLEVREFPDQYETVMRDLEELLSSYPDISFILVSLGQVDGRTLESLFSKYHNLFVTTGFTTGITKKQQANFKAKGGIVSQNWINMHRNGSWRPEWKGLIERYPDRFLLSFYNVFRPHYEFRMHKLNDFFMRNLGELEYSVANLLACGNAQLLFDLKISCR